MVLWDRTAPYKLPNYKAVLWMVPEDVKLLSVSEKEYIGRDGYTSSSRLCVGDSTMIYLRGLVYYDSPIMIFGKRYTGLKPIPFLYGC